MPYKICGWDKLYTMGAINENQGADVKCMGYGVYVDHCLCVLSDFTRLPLYGEGRKSWYITVFPCIFVLSAGWYCGTGVFGLIECQSLSRAFQTF